MWIQVWSATERLENFRAWVTELHSQFNRNAVASNWRNPFRVEKDVYLLPRVEATLGFET